MQYFLYRNIIYNKKNHQLGTGAFSTVKKGHHIRTPNSTYAIKCVERSKLSKEDTLALRDEVSILSQLRNCKHIIRLYDFFEEKQSFYLVMECVSGGELFDRIVEKSYYNEAEARGVCKILLEAVGYCHEHHVAHRDLKPENLLLRSKDDDSSIKIADFGFAKIVDKKGSLTTQCGTPVSCFLRMLLLLFFCWLVVCCLLYCC
jgi:serine/threonine protein kinase